MAETYRLATTARQDGQNPSTPAIAPHRDQVIQPDSVIAPAARLAAQRTGLTWLGKGADGVTRWYKFANGAGGPSDEVVVVAV